MMIPRVFGKLCFVDILLIINALHFNLCSGGWFALKVTKLSEHLKMHGSSICFNRLMELLTPHHQFGARVCTGLPPVNGYALRTFFHQEKGNRHAPCKVFMESGAICCCCWQVMAFCPLDGLFQNKGAPHSHAHIQTLMMMVDLGESKLSHTFITTSCPFQLCSRKWHVKMSKWSWHFDDEQYEVKETRT